MKDRALICCRPGSPKAMSGIEQRIAFPCLTGNGNLQREPRVPTAFPSHDDPPKREYLLGWLSESKIQFLWEPTSCGLKDAEIGSFSSRVR